MFDMIPPELQSQLIAWFIAGVGTTGTVIVAFAWSIVRGFKDRIDQSSKDRDVERDKEIAKMKNDVAAQESAIEKQKNDYDFRFAEFKAEEKREERLFELNEAHAKSYDMVANAVDLLSKNVVETNDQIEVFGQQLKRVVDSNGDVKINIDTLTVRLNEHIETANETLSNIQQEIADALDTTSSAQDRRLQKIFAEFTKIRRILVKIQNQNDKTKEIPDTMLDAIEASDAGDSDNANLTDNDIEEDVA